MKSKFQMGVLCGVATEEKSGGGGGASVLEGVLGDIKTKGELSGEISRLKAENERLRGQVGGGSGAAPVVPSVSVVSGAAVPAARPSSPSPAPVDPIAALEAALAKETDPRRIFTLNHQLNAARAGGGVGAADPARIEALEAALAKETDPQRIFTLNQQLKSARAGKSNG
jgi:hypothetical protein